MEERQGKTSSRGSSHQQHSHGMIETSDELLNCGAICCHPTWLQRFHNPIALLVVTSLGAICQGFLVNGALPVGISTVEKRFYLTSAQTGLWAAMYDIGVLFMLWPLSHWGSRAHKGRWLGVGLIVMAIGALITTLPHFTTGDYEKNIGGGNQTCLLEGAARAGDCDQSYVHNMQNQWYLLLFGMFIFGLGASPLYTLGVVYIDENVAQVSSAMYLAIFMALSSIGPALGYIIGARLLTVWGDVDKIPYDDTLLVDMSTADQSASFYGAWWASFVLVSLLSAVVAVPMLLFARQLPGAVKHRRKDTNQVNQKTSFSDANLHEELGFKSTVSAAILLLRNVTFDMLIVYQTVDAFLLNGMTTFLPKIVETIFAVSKGMAGLAVGGLLIPSIAIGNIVGGWLIKRYNWQVRRMMQATAVFSATSLFLALGILIRCDPLKFAGVNTAYASASNASSVSLLSSCNTACNCVSEFDPVCHEETGTLFATACYAGCTQSNRDGESIETFSNCSCTTDGGSVTRGLCQSEDSCMLPFVAFMICLGLVVTFTFLSAMPVQQAVLRSVPFTQRTLALSVSWLFMRVLGTIPGAIVFGMSFDGVCAVWREDPCTGANVTCERYHISSLVISLVVIALTVKTIQVVCMVVGVCSYASLDDDSTQATATESGSNKRIQPMKERSAHKQTYDNA